jgi:hypothetical protein
LVIRWTEIRRPAATAWMPATRRWAESHLGGVLLSGVVLAVGFNVPIARLPGLGAVTLAVAAGLELLRHPLVVARLSQRAAAAWAAVWPGASGTIGAATLIWLWHRLAMPAATLSATTCGIVAASAGAAGWLTRTWIDARLAPLGAAVTVLPCGWFLLHPPADSAAASLIPFLALAVAGHTAIRFWARHPHFHPSDLACLWMLALAGLWLGEPLLNARATGAGDSHWYALVMADALAQYQAGLFPLVGQSQYAFNGATFPGCFAPYYQVLGIAVHALSGGTLPVYAVQHATAVLSLLGGLFSASAVLRWLAPAAPRSFVVLLAFLYAASPAWLGAIYSMDMYMTFMTLPWLPLVCFGCVRTFVYLDRRALLWLVPPLSLTWYAHPPVALWTTLAVALSQLVRLCQRPQGWLREIRWLAGAAGLFFALTCLPFAAAANTDPSPEPFRHDYVLQTLRAHWAAAWFPVSAGADRLSDQQLGWGLAIVLIAGGGLALRRKSPAFAGLLAGAAGLLLLLAPLPGVQEPAWRLLPAAIKSVTDNWPSQRLYPVLAALGTVGAGAGLLRALRGRPHAQHALGAVLACAAAWSATEAAKFRRRGHATTLDAAASVRRLYPENLVLTRYAYAMFDHRPDYAADGVINPAMRQRLLASAADREIAGNASSARATPPAEVLTLKSRALGGGAYELSPDLTLQPGRDYLLEFEFPAQRYDGELSLEGPRLERRYHLPRDGGPAAFGSAPGQGNFITLATGGETPETVRWRFHAANPSARVPIRFARVRVIEFDRSQLPVRMESLLPYRAAVRSPAAAWLETPRMYLPGYTAIVDGSVAEVQRSRQGLAMIRVPPGVSHVSLSFTGPPILRAALWLAAAAWIGLPALVLLSRRKAPPGSAPQDMTLAVSGSARPRLSQPS